MPLEKQEEKDTRIFWSVLAWELLLQPNLRNISEVLFFQMSLAFTNLTLRPTPLTSCNFMASHRKNSPQLPTLSWVGKYRTRKLQRNSNSSSAAARMVQSDQ
jgi:hypothetical protein